MNPASHTRRQKAVSSLLIAASYSFIALLALVVPARGEAPGKPERADPARGAEEREEKPELVAQSGVNKKSPPQCNTRMRVPQGPIRLSRASHRGLFGSQEEDFHTEAQRHEEEGGLA